jgi:hypothetical protein
MDRLQCRHRDWSRQHKSSRGQPGARHSSIKPVPNYQVEHSLRKFGTLLGVAPRGFPCYTQGKQKQPDPGSHFSEIASLLCAASLQLVARERLHVLKNFRRYKCFFHEKRIYFIPDSSYAFYQTSARLLRLPLLPSASRRLCACVSLTVASEIPIGFQKTKNHVRDSLSPKFRTDRAWADLQVFVVLVTEHQHRNHASGVILIFN